MCLYQVCRIYPRYLEFTLGSNEAVTSFFLGILCRGVRNNKTLPIELLSEFRNLQTGFMVSGTYNVIYGVRAAVANA